MEDSLYAILTGRVQVLVNGRVLVEAGPGSTVGELAVLVPEARSATVVTLEPSGFLRVRKETVDDLIVDHPAFARSIIAVLVARLAGDVGAPRDRMTIDRTRADVALLAAQAVFFGVTSALLVIPANGIFLAAYGAEWLPLTYVGIAMLGTAASIVIARSLRRWTLPTVSVAVLAAIAATLLAPGRSSPSTGSAWPSAVAADPVPDPAPARLRDHRRPGRPACSTSSRSSGTSLAIVAGFVVGFTIGGFAAVPLLDLIGRARAPRRRVGDVVRRVRPPRPVHARGAVLPS